MWCNYFHFIISQIKSTKKKTAKTQTIVHEAIAFSTVGSLIVSFQILNISHRNNQIQKTFKIDFILFFYLIKIWLVSFYQFKINTHRNHVGKIRWTSNYFLDFFFWYYLQRSVFFDFPCLNYVEFFKNSCL